MAFPGTCKNCITVGTAQSWAADSAAAAGHGMAQCRPQDCPHDLYAAHEDDKEQRGLCGDSRSLSPFRLAPCCPGRFAAEACMPEAVDPLSSTGGAVDRQAPYFADKAGGGGGAGAGAGAGMFGDGRGASLRRVKPDVVAPGMNVLSARSDGDAFSGGTGGCRCCATSRPHGEPPSDTAGLVAMSGSEQAAAVVSAAVLLVRQYLHISIYIHVYMYICIYVYMYICIYVYTHMYSYIHTHILYLYLDIIYLYMHIYMCMYNVYVHTYTYI